MANTDPNERFQRMMEAARRREAIQAKALTDRPPGPLAGDLYAPPVAFQAAVGIALTHSHPKDSREWFAVLVDDFIAAGRADVIVPEAAAWGPLVLRCGLGLWLNVDALAELERVGVIPDVIAQDAVHRLANLVRGTAEPTFGQEEVEDTPEYEDWMPRLIADRVALETWRDERGMVLSIASFGRRVSGKLGTLPADEAGAGRAYALGASSGEILEDLAEAIDSAEHFVWQEMGDLAFRAGRQGVDVFWIGEPGAEAKPPRIRGRSAEGRIVAARWRTVAGDPSHRRTHPTFPWHNGEVSLMIGLGKGEHVTIRGPRNLES